MKFLFTCGGTGGHIYPAIAVADRLKDLLPESDILFVGAEDNMELELVPHSGYAIKSVKASSFHRGMKPGDILHNIRAIGKNAKALRQSKKIIKAFRPDIAIGTGGYVCYPVLRMANTMGVKTILHESNAIPGLTTRLLEKRVDRVLLGFVDSAVHFKNAKNIEYTGTPVREGFRSKSIKEAGTGVGPSGKPAVLSVWGSQGARYMNEKITEVIAKNETEGLFSHIHVPGNEESLKKIKRELAALGNEHLKHTGLKSYLHDMPEVMAACDLVVSRAGAITLNELASLGKPAILVPSPYVTGNHQEKNAMVLRDRGGALMIKEKDCTPALLYRTIVETVTDKEKLRRMSAAMTTMDAPDATDNIIQSVLNLIK